MWMVPRPGLLLVSSLAALAAVGCQSERTEVGASPSGQAGAVVGSGGGNDGTGGGGGDATGSGGGATGVGGGPLAEACGSFCAATESLPCHPDDCVVRCAEETATGCETEFEAFLRCVTPDPGNFTCSGDELVVSPVNCPDEFDELQTCL